MIRILGCLAVLLLMSLSCSKPTEPYVHEPRFGKNVSTLFGFEKQQPADGSMADFSWKDSNGVLRSFKELRGKVVVVNFWATWCPPCLAETPALRDIATDFAKDSVVVIGIAIDQDGAVYPKIEEFHRTKSLTYQVITDINKDVYSVYMQTHANSIPTTF